MKRVWAIMIDRVGPRPSHCWANAEAAKRHFQRARSEKIEWKELPSGTWVGEYRNHKRGIQARAFVYAIPIVQET